MCRLCVFPYALPLASSSPIERIPLLTRTMSSTDLDQQVQHLCSDFMKKRKSDHIERMLERWELHLSDSEHLCESLMASTTHSEEEDDASY